MKEALLENLRRYIDQASDIYAQNPAQYEGVPREKLFLLPEGMDKKQKYSHEQQVKERLNFLTKLAQNSEKIKDDTLTRVFDICNKSDHLREGDMQAFFNWCGEAVRKTK